jgi:hypothetical protein
VVSTSGQLLHRVETQLVLALFSATFDQMAATIHDRSASLRDTHELQSQYLRFKTPSESEFLANLVARVAHAVGHSEPDSPTR